MQYSQSFAPPKPFELCLLTPQLTINSCATCHCNKRVFKCPVIPMSIIISYGCTPITPYEIYHCLPWREWRHFFQAKTSTKSKLSLSSVIKNSWSDRSTQVLLYSWKQTPWRKAIHEFSKSKQVLTTLQLTTYFNIPNIPSCRAFTGCDSWDDVTREEYCETVVRLTAVVLQPMADYHWQLVLSHLRILSGKI